MSRYWRLAGIPSERDPVAMPVRVQPRMGAVVVQNLAQPAHLVLNQCIERVQDQRAHGRWPSHMPPLRYPTVSVSPPVVLQGSRVRRCPRPGFACQLREDGQQEALGLPRSGPGGDDDVAPTDRGSAKALPLMAIELGVFTEQRCRQPCEILKSLSERHGRAGQRMTRTGILRRGLNHGWLAEDPWYRDGSVTLCL